MAAIETGLNQGFGPPLAAPGAQVGKAPVGGPQDFGASQEGSKVDKPFDLVGLIDDSFKNVNSSSGLFSLADLLVFGLGTALGFDSPHFGFLLSQFSAEDQARAAVEFNRINSVIVQEGINVTFDLQQSVPQDIRDVFEPLLASSAEFAASVGPNFQAGTIDPFVASSAESLKGLEGFGDATRSNINLGFDRVGSQINQLSRRTGSRTSLPGLLAGNEFERAQALGGFTDTFATTKFGAEAGIASETANLGIFKTNLETGAFANNLGFQVQGGLAPIASFEDLALSGRDFLADEFNLVPGGASF